MLNDGSNDEGNVRPEMNETRPIINMWGKSSITLAGLPIFSGKPGENIKEFFGKIRQRAIIDGWSEKQTIAITKYQLTGGAFELFESEDVLSEEDITFVDIEKFLLDKYIKKIIPGQGALKLHKCIQHHKESVNEYATRLKITGRDLLKENLATIDPTDIADVQATRKRHEKDLIQQFQRGINADIAKMIMLELHRSPMITLEETVELAQQAEISNEILQQPKRQNEWRICETTERESDRRERNAYANNNGNYRKLQCYTCRKEGHTARECRSVKCYRCGRIGHRQNECRQPPNQNYTNNYVRGQNSTVANHGSRKNATFTNRNNQHLN